MALFKLRYKVPHYIAALTFSVVLVSCQNSGDDTSSNVYSSPVDKESKHKFTAPESFTLDSINLMSNQIDSIFKYLHKRKGFNGTVLVTKYDKVIYKGAFGYSDFTKKDTLSTKTAFQLASVSKQFTAMAVMMLKEQGKLSYEDSVQQYFPDFPYSGITIRHLLTHRSGLGNYTYFSDQLWPSSQKPMYNKDVIDLMVKHKPGIYLQPDTRFNYSNTGYALLASIVSKASGMSFQAYMRKHIFRPLKMTSTFTYKQNLPTLNKNIATGHTGGRRKRYPDHLDTVLGDKGLYSTVEDLYKWDQALYTEKLVKRETLEEAFTGSIPQKKKEEDYGFGWRIRPVDNGDTVVYHAGLWHGYTTYLLRNPKDHSALIILSNVPNGSLNYLKEIRRFLYPPRKQILELSKVSSSKQEKAKS